MQLNFLCYVCILLFAEFISSNRFFEDSEGCIPTLVFLPGESQGRGNLVDCHPWGCTESDMTEATYSSSSRYYLGQSYIYTDEEAEPKK